MKKKKTILIFSTMAAGMILTAQAEERAWYISEPKTSATSVTNEGLAVFAGEQNTPFNIWNPRTGEVKEIGGISAGQGIGGCAAFSLDGSLISAPAYNVAFPLPPANWEENSSEVAKDFHFNAVTEVINTEVRECWAVGSNADNTKGYLLRSLDGGKTWLAREDNQVVCDLQWNQVGWHTGLNDLCMWSYFGFFAGTAGTAYYKNTRGSIFEFDPKPAYVEKNVKTYWTVDGLDEVSNNLEAKYAVFGCELVDGTGAVWYTEDSGETWDEGGDVMGIPSDICHFGDTYYMVTTNGYIQKSEDHGIIWTVLLNAADTDIINIPKDGVAFTSIAFGDADNGMAVGPGYVIVTTDGGKTWKSSELPQEFASTEWTGLAFEDGKAYISGKSGVVLTSPDYGESWSQIGESLEGTTHFNSLMVCDGGITIAADHGTMYYTSSETSMEGYGASVYNVKDETWTPLATSGYFFSSERVVVSDPWDISGDGNTVVGDCIYKVDGSDEYALGYFPAAWVDGELQVLDKLWADKGENAQPRRCNYDGSVLVGWQSCIGPWYASVWRRQADGSYKQSMMFKDPNMTIDDVDVKFGEGNVQATYEALKKVALGQCNAVSADGRVIGGYGGEHFATGAWIYSEEKGLIDLGGDRVNGLNADGTLAVGPTWIWTEEEGMRSISSYCSERGIELEYGVATIYNCSPNGRYITGFGLDDNLDGHAFVIDLIGDKSGVDAIRQTKAAIYPNPVADELHIDLVYDNVRTLCSLYDMQGRLVKSNVFTAQSNTMNVTDLSDGLYILTVAADGAQKSFKVKVNH